jgi:hypothetical protein
VRPTTLGLATSLALCAACTPETTTAVADDAESAARALLSARLFEPPAALHARFVPDRPPEAFPLRMMAAGPEDLATARLDRLRMIDGRAVVTARVTLDGVAQLFGFWLERQEGVWRVAGWEETPTPLPSPDTPVPERAPDPPAALLGPFFRAAHPVLGLPLPTLAPAVSDAAANPAATVKVDLKPPAVAGDCKAREVAASVEHATAALTACYQTALAGEAPRLGRITYRLQYTASTPGPRATLVESTLLLTGLTDCLGAALEATRLENRTCQATVPMVFIPAKVTSR